MSTLLSDAQWSLVVLQHISPAAQSSSTWTSCVKESGETRRPASSACPWSLSGLVYVAHLGQRQQGLSLETQCAPFSPR